MYTIVEREKIKYTLVNYLSKNKGVLFVCLVGSSATGKVDLYSDLDFTVVLKDNDVKEIWEEFYKVLIDENIFRKFKVEFGINDYLVGLFLNNGLELDIGFTTLNNFEKKNLNKPNLNYQVLYTKSGFQMPKIISTAKYNGNILLEQADSDIWYNFKNAMFALKRNRIFRCLNEIEECRNYVIRIIASFNNLEGKHFKEIDNLSVEFKNKLKQTYPSEISYKELKKSLINVMELFYETLKTNNKENKAEEYRRVFKNLIKDIDL